jgi:hypothetical protein
MKSLSIRRRRNLGILLLLSIVVIVIDRLLSVSLYPVAFVSGWLLFSLVALLAAYNIRKKLPFLPLGSSSTWLQFHIYGGLLSGVVFVVHIAGRVPNGGFEVVLSALFLGVFFSGVIGLLLSRWIPPRLTTRARDSQEVLFERIPIFVRRIRDEVEAMVLECGSQAESTVVPAFYASRLKPFFERPMNFWSHVLHIQRPRLKLLREIESQEGYLSEVEKSVMGDMVERVKQKDDLDYQYALQALLKYWLFVHIPLTSGLLVFVVFHLVLVYAFAGGAR